MANNFIQMPANGAGEKVDTESLVVGANTVNRERVQIAGDDATDIAPVTAADGLLVNLGANNDVTISDGGNTITVDGTVTVTEPVSVDDNGGSLTVDNATLAVVGGGAEATALRVTIANDSTGVVSIDDNGGVITVDGTVAVTHAALTELAGAIDTEMQVDVVSSALPTGAATAANQLPDNHQVTISNPGDIGGGTQYTEDAAAAADPVGNALIMVRDDALSGQTTTDGDNVAVRGTDKGEMYVKHVDSIPVTDAGGSLTIDGTVAVSAITDPVAVTQSGVWDEVGIHDSGNSITVDNAALSVVGGGAEATALRVTLANDSTGVVSVDDNGGSLTVDGTVTVTATNLDIRDIDAATDDIAVHGDVGILDQLDLTNANPATVAIVDGDGTQITSFGGGTQYTEGDTDASITGTALLFEGAADTLVAAPGTAANGLDVDVTRVSGTVTVDGSAVTQPISHAALTELAGAIDTEMQVDVVGALPTGDNNIGNVDVASVPAPLSTTGGGTEAAALRVTVANDSTGVLSVDDNGGSLTVDGTVTVTASDLDIRNLAPATDQVEVVGDVAADGAAAGNPVQIGVVQETMADSAPSTRVSADADIGYAAGSDGAMYVIPSGPQTWSYHENSSSALTDTSVHAAPGAGLSLYVTDIIVSTGAATAFNIFFEEGASTVLGPYYLEAVAGRGFQVHFQTPKKITANTALTVTTSAAIAHGIDVTGFIARG